MALLRICLALVVWLGLASAASAERRVALIVGNGAYSATPALPNPASDANAIAAVLERLDFEVLKGIDLDRAAFRRILRDFSARLPGSDIALFFYAGHGVQVHGKNFLLPVDADIQSETDLDFETVDIDLVLRQMERHPAVKLVLLDACRNNPFERSLVRSMGATRAVGALGAGLAPIEARGGVMIGFATDPGAVALDGTGSNSPFTEALLKHIETPGLEINVMMTRVRADVFAATGEAQRPWVTTSLIGEVYLAPEAVVTATAPAPPAAEVPAGAAARDVADEAQLELTFWKAIENSTNPTDYEVFLLQYPDGILAELARSRLAALTVAVETETAVVAAPAATAEAAEAGRSGDAAAPGTPDAAAPVAVAPPAEKAIELAAADPRQPVSAEPRRDCAQCPAMVRLAGGAFRMGSPPGKGEAEEWPQLDIVLAPFEISKHEITLAQYKAFMDETGYVIPMGCFVWSERGKLRWAAAAWRGEPGYRVTLDMPVSCVSFDDAQAYVDWLNKRSGGGYRLPTEAEFEYAARAGSAAAHFWEGGGATACRAANGAARDSKIFRWRNQLCADGFSAVASVGSFPDNAFGLNDMIGNLWEWTADCWSNSHKGAAVDGSARIAGSCQSRVLRGGSWDDPVDNLRSAHRVGIPANRRQANVGFRVARTIE